MASNKDLPIDWDQTARESKHDLETQDVCDKGLATLKPVH